MGASSPLADVQFNAVLEAPRGILLRDAPTPFRIER